MFHCCVQALTEVMRATGITTWIPTTTTQDMTTDAWMTATSGGTMKNSTSRVRFPSGLTITDIADPKVLALGAATEIMMAKGSGELSNS